VAAERDAELVGLLEELIRVDSTNSDLVDGGAGEGPIADCVTAWLTQRGFACHRLEERPGRPSVVAVHAGTGGGRSIMLNGHLDAVSLASYAGDGLAPVRRDGKVFGRGAYDMKSGIAAMMVTAARVAALPHAGDIVLALVADEEHASAGTEEVLRAGFTADAAIVVEPTEMDIVTAHRGFAWFDVTIHGRAAHGSRRDLGVDAIAHAGAFLTALAAHDIELSEREPHPLLGTGNIHASLIRGGEELSSYPASCTVSLERRTLPGETPATVEAELRDMLDRSTADGDISYEIEQGLHRSPFHVDASAVIVRTLAAAVAQSTGEEPRHRGEPFWTDAALLSDAGIPTVLFGVSGGGAHAAQEWVDVDSLITVTDVLGRVVAETTASPRHEAIA
jgi:acetylornithine deacetylase